MSYARRAVKQVWGTPRESRGEKAHECSVFFAHADLLLLLLRLSVAVLWIVLLALPAHCAPERRKTPADVTLRITLPYSAQPDDKGNALVWRLNLKKSADGFLVDTDAIRAGIANADDDIMTLLEDQTVNLDGHPLSALIASLSNTFALSNKRQVTLLVTKASVRLANGNQRDFPVPPAPLPADSGVTQLGASADITLTMTTQQPGISALEILVVTRRAVLYPQEVQSQIVALGNVNVQQIMPLPLHVRQQAIPIRMLYTRQDDALGQPALLTALGRAGWLLYRAAAQQGIDLEQPSPTTNATTAFIRDAGMALALPGAPTARISPVCLGR